MFTEVLPLGALGDLPSFSILSGDAIQMDLNVSATVFPGPKTSDFGKFIGTWRLFVEGYSDFSCLQAHVHRKVSDESAPATSLQLPLLILCFIFCLLIFDGGMSKSGSMLLN